MPSLHVAYTQQGYEAGNGREEMAVGARIPVQAEREERAGQAGHCDAQIQNGNLCQRLFLARTRRLFHVCNAKEQHGVLAGENRPQPRTGRTELPITARRRLASNRHLGMQPHQRQNRTHYAAGSRLPQPQFSCSRTKK